MSDTTSDYNISYSKENLIKIQHVGVTAKMQQQPLRMLLCHNYNNSSTATDIGEEGRASYSHDVNRNAVRTAKYNKFSNENCTDGTDDKELYVENEHSDHEDHCAGVCEGGIETDSTMTTENSPTLLYRMKTVACVPDKKLHGRNRECADAPSKRERNCTTMTPSKIEFQLCDSHCPLKRSQRYRRHKLNRRLFVNVAGASKCHKRCPGHICKRNKSFMYRLRRPFVNLYVKYHRNRRTPCKLTGDRRTQPIPSQSATIDDILNDYPVSDVDKSKSQAESKSQPQQQQRQQQKPQQQQHCAYNHKCCDSVAIGIYPFDHGCPEYLKTYDLPPQVFSSVISEQTVHYTTRFWAEFFGSIHVGVAFLITFVLQAYRFVLFSLINTLLVGVLHMTSDYFLKPLLAVIFNGFVQPPLLFVYNVFASLRDLLSPIAEIIDNFMKPLARLGNSIRLVHVHNDKRSIMKGV